MTNTKSTVAMKLAHKIQKAFPKMAFQSCLTYAWKQVRISLDIALRILSSEYKLAIKVRETMFGKVRDIAFYVKGWKNSVKRAFKGELKRDYVLSLWAGF